MMLIGMRLRRYEQIGAMGKELFSGVRVRPGRVVVEIEPDLLEGGCEFLFDRQGALAAFASEGFFCADIDADQSRLVFRRNIRGGA
jgi:hypothetical protein